MPLIASPAEAPSAPTEAVGPMNSFVRASQETLLSFDQVSKALDVSAVPVGPLSVTSGGFLRNVVLVVTASGGTGGSAVAAADSPFNVIDNVMISDTNGRPIVGPLSGYELFLANVFGAYKVGDYDLRNYPSFSAPDADGNFKFAVSLPLEITPKNGMGSLANLTSAATYKVSWTQSPSTVVYDTSPAGSLPTITVELFVDIWSQPPPTGPGGIRNATVPPHLGTTQFWSVESHPVNAGEQNIRFTRMGNLIRNHILIFRDSSGDRVDAFPPTWRIGWDNKIVSTPTKVLMDDQVKSRFDVLAPTGTVVMDHTHDADGRPGNEDRNGWLPTVPGTKFEITGAWPSPGTLYILTNDVAVQGSVRLASGG